MFAGGLGSLAAVNEEWGEVPIGSHYTLLMDSTGVRDRAENRCALLKWVRIASLIMTRFMKVGDE